MTDIVADFELQPQPQIDADFNILEEETINAEFVLPNAMYHDRLEHRDYPDQHPMSAITDLAETLSEISSSVEDEKIRAETVEGDLNDLTTSEKSNLVGAINELDSSKQNNLTAGLGIDITNNEVSVTTPTLINSATGTNSLTVLGTSASQNGITNVGVSAEGTATNATAVGYSSSAEGAASTAIGKGANAHATRSIALGALSVASGDYSIAIGSHNSLYSSSARATAQSAIQLGNGTNSTPNTFQVGSYTLLNTSTGIIPNDRIDIDSVPTENSTNTVSSGGVYSKQGDLTTLTTTDKTNLVSAINELDSDKQENITAGTGIDITSNIVSVTDPTLVNNGNGTKALAVGKLSQSTAEGGLAVGYGARANSTYGTAVGYEARANNTNTTAIGKGAEATQQRAIAIGSGAEANAQDAIAIKGINNTANTMQVYTYTLLDMATGLIPNARIDIDSTPTANSTNTVSSGGTYTMVNDVITGTTDIDYDNTTSGLSSNTVKGAIDELASDVSDIDSLIPNQASSTNQLADKDFVNSSIATNTANFIGTFNSVAELEAYSGTVTNNDYAFVVGTDSAGNTVYDRYKYTDATTPASWIFEYELNNSSFTSAQWSAINSGATSTNISQIGTNTNDISTINTTIGGYGDIVTHDVSEFATAAQGSLADTAVQPADLATVATSGSYNDLTDTPTIGNATLTIQQNSVSVGTFTANATTNATVDITVPTDTSDLTNNAGYITGITSSDVTTALGYTPYNSTNPSGYISGITSSDVTTALGYTPYDSANPAGYTTNVGTVTSVNNISPVSGDVTLSIPTVNNPTITLTQGGVTKGSFTLNQASGDTIDFDAGGGSSRNIGEIIQSTIPLTDAGLHLLDGSLISGSGSYSAFVDYIGNLNNIIPVSEYVYNVSTTGTLSNNNGVLSGFSSSNTASIPTLFNNGSYSWEKVIKITTGNDVTTDQILFGNSENTPNGCTMNLNSGVLKIYGSSNSSTWNLFLDVASTLTLSVNTTYYIKYYFTGSAYKVDVSTTGAFAGEETNYITVTESTPATSQPISLGTYVGQSPFLGSIDLNESYIDINGQRWWNGVTIKRACFCTEEEWQASVATYGVCGKFVYDTVNNTVRLPKIAGFTESTIDPTVLGYLTEAGLPNITTGTIAGLNTVTSDMAVGALKYGQSTAKHGTYYTVNTNNDPNLSFDASLSNSIYGNSSTVQPQSIKVLYYIVIATSIKTQIEVDIDEIAADLNGKADVDLSNMNASGKSAIISASTPSGSITETTLTVGTPYTATVTGEYYLFGCVSSAARTIYVNDYAIGELGGSGWSREMITLNLRVGDVVNLTTSFNDLTRFTLNWRGK